MCKKPPANFLAAMQEKRSDSDPGSARSRRPANPCGAWKEWWWVVSLCVSIWGLLFANCYWSHEPIAFCTDPPAQQATNLEARAILSLWPKESLKHKGKAEELEQFFCPTKNFYLSHKFCKSKRLACSMQDGCYAERERTARKEGTSLRQSAVSDSSPAMVFNNIDKGTIKLACLTREVIYPDSDLIYCAQKTARLEEDQKKKTLLEETKQRELK